MARSSRTTSRYNGWPADPCEADRSLSGPAEGRHGREVEHPVDHTRHLAGVEGLRHHLVRALGQTPLALTALGDGREHEDRHVVVGGIVAERRQNVVTR